MPVLPASASPYPSAIELGARFRALHDQAESLRPFRGRFVATLDSGKVLVDGATPEEVISWLRPNGLKADSIFRVPLDPSVDMGGFAS